MEDEQLEEHLMQLDALQSPCTHCGLCLEGCVTYQASGWEHESPRGRIRLAYEFMHGKLKPESKVLETFDSCLGCQRCEEMCPLSVKYGSIRKIVQEIRYDLVPRLQQMIDQKWIRMAFRMGAIFWRHLIWRWFPDAHFPKSLQGSYLRRYGSHKKEKQAINLAVGCVQDMFSHELIHQAKQLLIRLGYSIHLPKSQPCCGAIFERLKGHPKALAYQKKRETTFLNAFSKETCFLSMACQCQAETLGAEGLDVYQLILEGWRKGICQFGLAQSMEGYYQPYCRQGKNIEKDPAWYLLNQVSNLKIHLVPFSQSCCGGYCGESICNPVAAKNLLKPKQELPEGSIMIVTSPDCQAQFLLHGKNKLNVIHAIELLAKACQ
jgi:glycolate oxidase iron-sulfur subunit